MNIPESVATVEDSYLADSVERRALSESKEEHGFSSTLIYLLQDAHTNESAQRNIAKAIDIILEQQRKKGAAGPAPFYIFLEAGTGDDSLSNLRHYGTAEERKQVSEKYLKRGLIQGPDYLDLNSDKNFILWGVENKELYWKALDDYRYLKDKRPDINNYLDKIERTIKTLKSKLYNPSLYLLDQKKEEFLKGNLSMTEYLDSLEDEQRNLSIPSDLFPNLLKLKLIKQKEKAINFEKAQGEQLKAIESLNAEDQRLLKESLKTNDNKSLFLLDNEEHKEEKGFYALLEEKMKGQGAGDSLNSIPNLSQYFDYLHQIKKLNLKVLLKEKDDLEAIVFNFLSKTKDERTLIQIDKNLKVLRKLLNLTLTSDEYETYFSSATKKADQMAIEELLDIRHLTGFLNKKIMELKQYYEDALFLEPSYEACYQKALDFYTLAKERDRVFLKNLMQKMEAENQSTAILVSGGFHTDHLKKLLKQNNISYVSITPQVLQETNTKKYEQILLSQGPTLSSRGQGAVEARLPDGQAIPADHAAVLPGAELFAPVGPDGARLAVAEVIKEELGTRSEQYRPEGARMAEKRFSKNRSRRDLLHTAILAITLILGILAVRQQQDGKYNGFTYLSGPLQDDAFAVGVMRLKDQEAVIKATHKRVQEYLEALKKINDLRGIRDIVKGLAQRGIIPATEVSSADSMEEEALGDLIQKTVDRYLRRQNMDVLGEKAIRIVNIIHAVRQLPEESGARMAEENRPMQKSFRVNTSFKNYGAVSKAGAEFYKITAASAIRRDGVFRVNLSGGETPTRFLEIVADIVPAEIWNRTEVYWTNDQGQFERYKATSTIVPRYLLRGLRKKGIKMRRSESESDQVGAEGGLYFPLDGTAGGNRSPEAREREALRYDALKKKRLGPDGNFHLTVLGLGSDCQILGATPNSHVLDREDDRWVVVNQTPRKGRWISDTIIPLKRSENVLVLVSGPEENEKSANGRASRRSPRVTPGVYKGSALFNLLKEDWPWEKLEGPLREELKTEEAQRREEFQARYLRDLPGHVLVLGDKNSLRPEVRTYQRIDKLPVKADHREGKNPRGKPLKKRPRVIGGHGYFVPGSLFNIGQDLFLEADFDLLHRGPVRVERYFKYFLALIDDRLSNLDLHFSIAGLNMQFSPGYIPAYEQLWRGAADSLEADVKNAIEQGQPADMLGQSDNNMVLDYALSHSERYPYICGIKRPEVPRRIIRLNPFFRQDVLHAISQVKQIADQSGLPGPVRDLIYLIADNIEIGSSLLANPLVTGSMMATNPLWRVAINLFFDSLYEAAGMPMVFRHAMREAHQTIPAYYFLWELDAIIKFKPEWHEKAAEFTRASAIPQLLVSDPQDPLANHESALAYAKETGAELMEFHMSDYIQMIDNPVVRFFAPHLTHMLHPEFKRRLEAWLKKDVFVRRAFEEDIKDVLDIQKHSGAVSDQWFSTDSIQSLVQNGQLWLAEAVIRGRKRKAGVFILSDYPENSEYLFISWVMIDRRYRRSSRKLRVSDISYDEVVRMARAMNKKGVISNGRPGGALEDIYEEFGKGTGVDRDQFARSLDENPAYKARLILRYIFKVRPTDASKGADISYFIDWLLNRYPGEVDEGKLRELSRPTPENAWDPSKDDTATQLVALFHRKFLDEERNEQNQPRYALLDTTLGGVLSRKGAYAYRIVLDQIKDKEALNSRVLMSDKNANPDVEIGRLKATAAASSKERYTDYGDLHPVEQRIEVPENTPQNVYITVNPHKPNVAADMVARIHFSGTGLKRGMRKLPAYPSGSVRFEDTIPPEFEGKFTYEVSFDKGETWLWLNQGPSDDREIVRTVGQGSASAPPTGARMADQEIPVRTEKMKRPDATIVYSEFWGNPSNTTVLAAHSFMMDRSDWTPVLGELSREGHRGIAPDSRGHGDSELGTVNAASFNLTEVDDLHFLLQRKVFDAPGVKNKNVVLLGHSRGGLIMRKLYEKIPDRVPLLYISAAPLSGESIQMNWRKKAGHRILKFLDWLRVLKLVWALPASIKAPIVTLFFKFAIGIDDYASFNQRKLPHIMKADPRVIVKAYEAMLGEKWDVDEWAGAILKGIKQGQNPMIVVVVASNDELVDRATVERQVSELRQRVRTRLAERKISPRVYDPDARIQFRVVEDADHSLYDAFEEIMGEAVKRELNITKSKTISRSTTGSWLQRLRSVVHRIVFSNGRLALIVTLWRMRRQSPEWWKEHEALLGNFFSASFRRNLKIEDPFRELLSGLSEPERRRVFKDVIIEIARQICPTGTITLSSYVRPSDFGQFLISYARYHHAPHRSAANGLGPGVVNYWLKSKGDQVALIGKRAAKIQVLLHSSMVRHLIEERPETLRDILNFTSLRGPDEEEILLEIEKLSGEELVAQAPPGTKKWLEGFRSDAGQPDDLKWEHDFGLVIGEVERLTRKLKESYKDGLSLPAPPGGKDGLNTLADFYRILLILKDVPLEKEFRTKTVSAARMAIFPVRESQVNEAVGWVYKELSSEKIIFIRRGENMAREYLTSSWDFKRALESFLKMNPGLDEEKIRFLKATLVAAKAGAPAGFSPEQRDFLRSFLLGDLSDVSKRDFAVMIRDSYPESRPAEHSIMALQIILEEAKTEMSGARMAKVLALKIPIANVENNQTALSAEEELIRRSEEQLLTYLLTLLPIKQALVLSLLWVNTETLVYYMMMKGTWVRQIAGLSDSSMVRGFPPEPWLNERRKSIAKLFGRSYELICQVEINALKNLARVIVNGVWVQRFDLSKDREIAEQTSRMLQRIREIKEALSHSRISASVRRELEHFWKENPNKLKWLRHIPEAKNPTLDELLERLENKISDLSGQEYIYELRKIAESISRVRSKGSLTLGQIYLLVRKLKNLSAQTASRSTYAYLFSDFISAIKTYRFISDNSPDAIFDRTTFKGCLRNIRSEMSGSLKGVEVARRLDRLEASIRRVDRNHILVSLNPILEFLDSFDEDEWSRYVALGPVGPLLTMPIPLSNKHSDAVDRTMSGREGLGKKEGARVATVPLPVVSAQKIYREVALKHAAWGYKDFHFGEQLLFTLLYMTARKAAMDEGRMAPEDVAQRLFKRATGTGASVYFKAEKLDTQQTLWLAFTLEVSGQPIDVVYDYYHYAMRNPLTPEVKGHKDAAFMYALLLLLMHKDNAYHAKVIVAPLLNRAELFVKNKDRLAEDIERLSKADQLVFKMALLIAAVLYPEAQRKTGKTFTKLGQVYKLYRALGDIVDDDIIAHGPTAHVLMTMAAVISAEIEHGARAAESRLRTQTPEGRELMRRLEGRLGVGVSRKEAVSLMKMGSVSSPPRFFYAAWLIFKGFASKIAYFETGKPLISDVTVVLDLNHLKGANFVGILTGMSSRHHEAYLVSDEDGRGRLIHSLLHAGLRGEALDALSSKIFTDQEYVRRLQKVSGARMATLREIAQLDLPVINMMLKLIRNSGVQPSTDRERRAMDELERMFSASGEELRRIVSWNGRNKAEDEPIFSTQDLWIIQILRLHPIVLPNGENLLDRWIAWRSGELQPIPNLSHTLRKRFFAQIRPFIPEELISRIQNEPLQMMLLVFFDVLFEGIPKLVIQFGEDVFSLSLIRSLAEDKKDHFIDSVGRLSEVIRHTQSRLVQTLRENIPIFDNPVNLKTVAQLAQTANLMLLLMDSARDSTLGIMPEKGAPQMRIIRVPSLEGKTGLERLREESKMFVTDTCLIFYLYLGRTNIILKRNLSSPEITDYLAHRSADDKAVDINRMRRGMVLETMNEVQDAYNRDIDQAASPSEIFAQLGHLIDTAFRFVRSFERQKAIDQAQSRGLKHLFSSQRQKLARLKSEYGARMALRLATLAQDSARAEALASRLAFIPSEALKTPNQGARAARGYTVNPLYSLQASSNPVFKLENRRMTVLHSSMAVVPLIDAKSLVVHLRLLRDFGIFDRSTIFESALNNKLRISLYGHSDFLAFSLSNVGEIAATLNRLVKNGGNFQVEEQDILVLHVVSDSTDRIIPVIYNGRYMAYFLRRLRSDRPDLIPHSIYFNSIRNSRNRRLMLEVVDDQYDERTRINLKSVAGILNLVDILNENVAEGARVANNPSFGSRFSSGLFSFAAFIGLVYLFHWVHSFPIKEKKKLRDRFHREFIKPRISHFVKKHSLDPVVETNLSYLLVDVAHHELEKIMRKPFRIAEAGAVLIGVGIGAMVASDLNLLPFGELSTWAIAGLPLFGGALMIGSKYFMRRTMNELIKRGSTDPDFVNQVLHLDSNPRHDASSGARAAKAVTEDKISARIDRKWRQRGIRESRTLKIQERAWKSEEIVVSARAIFYETLDSCFFEIATLLLPVPYQYFMQSSLRPSRLGSVQIAEPALGGQNIEKVLQDVERAYGYLFERPYTYGNIRSLIRFLSYLTDLMVSTVVNPVPGRDKFTPEDIYKIFTNRATSEKIAHYEQAMELKPGKGLPFISRSVHVIGLLKEMTDYAAAGARAADLTNPPDNIVIPELRDLWRRIKAGVLPKISGTEDLRAEVSAELDKHLHDIRSVQREEMIYRLRLLAVLSERDLSLSTVQNSFGIERSRSELFKRKLIRRLTIKSSDFGRNRTLRDQAKHLLYDFYKRKGLITQDPHFNRHERYSHGARMASATKESLFNLSDPFVQNMAELESAILISGSVGREKALEITRRRYESQTILPVGYVEFPNAKQEDYYSYARALLLKKIREGRNLDFQKIHTKLEGASFAILTPLAGAQGARAAEIDKVLRQIRILKHEAGLAVSFRAEAEQILIGLDSVEKLLEEGDIAQAKTHLETISDIDLPNNGKISQGFSTGLGIVIRELSGARMARRRSGDTLKNPTASVKKSKERDRELAKFVYMLRMMRSVKKPHKRPYLGKGLRSNLRQGARAANQEKILDYIGDIRQVKILQSLKILAQTHIIIPTTKGPLIPEGDFEVIQRSFRALGIYFDSQEVLARNLRTIPLIVSTIDRALRKLQNKHRVNAARMAQILSIHDGISSWLVHFGGYLEGGLRTFHFDNGMQFLDEYEWWGAQKKRARPHEGMDLFRYTDRSGALREVSVGTLVPVIYTGTVVNIFDDFMAKTIVVRHNVSDTQSRRLYSLYSHVEPLPGIKIGSEIPQYGAVGKIAVARRRTDVPSHLHLTLLLASEGFYKYGEINYESISMRKDIFRLINPHAGEVETGARMAFRRNAKTGAVPSELSPIDELGSLLAQVQLAPLRGIDSELHGSLQTVHVKVSKLKKPAGHYQITVTVEPIGDLTTDYLNGQSLKVIVNDGRASGIDMPFKSGSATLWVDERRNPIGLTVASSPQPLRYKLSPVDTMYADSRLTRPSRGARTAIKPKDWLRENIYGHSFLVDRHRYYLDYYETYGPNGFRIDIVDETGRFIGSYVGLVHDDRVENEFIYVVPERAGQGFEDYLSRLVENREGISEEATPELKLKQRIHEIKEMFSRQLSLISFFSEDKTIDLSLQTSNPLIYAVTGYIRSRGVRDLVSPLFLGSVVHGLSFHESDLDMILLVDEKDRLEVKQKLTLLAVTLREAGMPVDEHLMHEDSYDVVYTVEELRRSLKSVGFLPSNFAVWAFSYLPIETEQDRVRHRAFKNMLYEELLDPKLVSRVVQILRNDVKFIEERMVDHNVERFLRNRGGWRETFFTMLGLMNLLQKGGDHNSPLPYEGLPELAIAFDVPRIFRFLYQRVNPEANGLAIEDVRLLEDCIERLMRIRTSAPNRKVSEEEAMGIMRDFHTIASKVLTRFEATIIAGARMALRLATLAPRPAFIPSEALKTPNRGARAAGLSDFAQSTLFFAEGRITDFVADIVRRRRKAGRNARQMRFFSIEPESPYWEHLFEWDFVHLERVNEDWEFLPVVASPSLLGPGSFAHIARKPSGRKFIDDLLIDGNGRYITSVREVLNRQITDNPRMRKYADRRMKILSSEFMRSIRNNPGELLTGIDRRKYDGGRIYISEQTFDGLHLFLGGKDHFDDRVHLIRDGIRFIPYIPGARAARHKDGGFLVPSAPPTTISSVVANEVGEDPALFLSSARMALRRGAEGPRLAQGERRMARSPDLSRPFMKPTPASLPSLGRFFVEVANAQPVQFNGSRLAVRQLVQGEAGEYDFIYTVKRKGKKGFLAEANGIRLHLADRKSRTTKNKSSAPRLGMADLSFMEDQLDRGVHPQLSLIPENGRVKILDLDVDYFSEASFEGQLAAYLDEFSKGKQTDFRNAVMLLSSSSGNAQLVRRAMGSDYAKVLAGKGWLFDELPQELEAALQEKTAVQVKLLGVRRDKILDLSAFRHVRPLPLKVLADKDVPAVRAVLETAYAVGNANLESPVDLERLAAAWKMLSHTGVDAAILLKILKNEKVAWEVMVEYALKPLAPVDWNLAARYLKYRLNVERAA